MGDAQQSSERWPGLRSDVQLLNTALQSDSGLVEVVTEIVDRRIDLAQITQRVFGNYCEEILEDYAEFMSKRQLSDFVTLHNKRLQNEFREHCVVALVDYLHNAPFTTLHLTRIEEDTKEAKARVAVTVRSEDEATPQTLVLHLQFPGPNWQLVDFKIFDGRLVSDLLRSRFRNILENEYSLPVLEAQMRKQRYVVLEDFSTTESGRLPKGWGWRNKDRDKAKPYTVVKAGDHRYLAAKDTGSSVILLKVAHWNPREYPILTWCWRAESLPPGGNERYGPTNDSAAGLYVVFSQNWIGIPRQIKYVWSSTLPEGTVDRRKRFARPWFFVVETGNENVGRWVFEQVDLIADYARVYRGAPKNRTRGLGILTDANSTDSYAEAYYTDFRVWTREALEMGHVTNHCECLQGPSHVKSVSASISVSQVDINSQ